MFKQIPLVLLFAATLFLGLMPHAPCPFPMPTAGIFVMEFGFSTDPRTRM